MELTETEQAAVRESFGAMIRRTPGPMTAGRAELYLRNLTPAQGAYLRAYLEDWAATTSAQLTALLATVSVQSETALAGIADRLAAWCMEVTTP